MENKPEIRFKDFNASWEQRKLSDISETFSGGTPSVGKSEYYGGSIPFIRSAEINSDSTELFLTEKGLENSSARLVSKGDILYALYGATSGEVGICKVDGAINQAILAIRPKKEIDSNYLNQWFRTHKDSIVSTYLQGGQGNLSGQIIKGLEIELPVSEEQQHIGTFFQKLDDTIALHQRKLDLFKDMKEALLAKMFPSEGRPVPKIRFKNFTEDWEQREFGEITGRKSETSDDPYLLNVEYEDIVSEFGVLNKSLKDKPGGKKGIKFLPGDVLYGKLRPYLHNWLLPTFSGLAIGDFWVLSSTIIDSSFLYRLIQTPLFDEVANQSAGTKMPRADWKNVSASEFMIPSQIEEQKQIGAFFQKLDETITLQQRKLGLLKDMKEALLAKMFPKENFNV